MIVGRVIEREDSEEEDSIFMDVVSRKPAVKPRPKFTPRPVARPRSAAASGGGGGGKPKAGASLDWGSLYGADDTEA